MPSARVSNAVKYEASISKCWHFLMYTVFLLSYVKWTFHAVYHLLLLYSLVSVGPYRKLEDMYHDVNILSKLKWQKYIATKHARSGVLVLYILHCLKNQGECMSVDGERICTLITTSIRLTRTMMFSNTDQHGSVVYLIVNRGRGGLLVNTSDSGSRGLGFEPHSGCCVVCLSKTCLPPPPKKKKKKCTGYNQEMTEKLFTGTFSIKPKNDREPNRVKYSLI